MFPIKVLRTGLFREKLGQADPEALEDEEVSEDNELASGLKPNLPSRPSIEKKKKPVRSLRTARSAENMTAQPFKRSRSVSNMRRIPVAFLKR